MGVVDEKDYIMRMIKEMVQVLFSLVFGKKYVSVELEDENKYEVSGNTLKYFFDMIDQGDINEAENLLLEDLDYTNKEEVMAACLHWCASGFRSDYVRTGGARASCKSCRTFLSESKSNKR